jgi:tRNA-2-methylthio-N6-dimethylallyladenosine synthase
MRLFLKRLSSISQIPDLKTFLSQSPDSHLKPIESGSLFGLKYFLQTYGCQMNENDSEIVSAILSKAGLEPSESAESVLIT